ncbi:hypothetical protein F2Q69_00049635 [Brassica cretica]|uniref:Uncharacterized protein n=1 Tax=Brassica cretica TaxID=69181 RepID=A0A8S9PSA6_BRACR|nr:hypothetical protein F2Q69_00049635 [Brassica cretica]
MMHSVHTSMMQDKPHGPDKNELRRRLLDRERELSFGNASWLRTSIGQEKAASCSCLDQDANMLKLISGTLAVQAEIAVSWN